MKRLNFFLVGIAALGMAFFTSCGDTTTNSAPVITFDNTAPVAAVGGEVTLNGEIVAEAKLDEVKIFVVVGSDETQFGSAITSFSSTEINTDDDLNYVFHLNVTGLTEDCKIKIEATDKDNQTATKSIDVTVGGSSGNLQAEQSITLGGQDNSNGSFYASLSGGSVYTTALLKSGSHFGEIDLIYYVGATNKEAIFSPKAIVDADISWGGLVATTLWGTPNATKFKLAVAADYTDATYASVATLGADASLDLANGGDTPIEGLKTGDVYAFKTAGGKYGVFKVTAVTAGATNTITLAVKVQE
jgi:hypothetical protein